MPACWQSFNAGREIWGDKAVGRICLESGKRPATEDLERLLDQVNPQKFGTTPVFHWIDSNSSSSTVFPFSLTR